MSGEPWIRFRMGRDLMRGGGWAMHLCLFPARELMRPDEQGLLILSGLRVEILFNLDCKRWLDFWVQSDIDEIATRRAATPRPMVQA